MPANPTSSQPPANGVPSPPTPLRLHVTSEAANLASVRRAIEQYATAAGFDDEAVGQLGLVANEALANVIRHAYKNQPGKPIDVSVEPLIEPHDGLELRLRIRDWGTGVNPETAPKRGYIPGEPGGLGLVCLRELVDSAEYTPQPDGMLLTLIKKKKCLP